MHIISSFLYCSLRLAYVAAGPGPTLNMTIKGDTKCFSAGSTAPDLNLDDGLILYSMRFCPFAERVRIVLAAKEIPHQIVNINLRSKPDWFLERNPLGKVPTVEESGHKLTYESLILAEYLDDKFGGLKILPTDPHERAKQKMLVEVIREKFLAKFIAAQFEGGEEKVKAAAAGLFDVEPMLKDSFFTGPTVAWADIMIWPWMHRLDNLKHLRGADIPDEKYPKILAWIERMHQLPYIKSTCYPVELTLTFARPYIAGQPNYDEGL